MFRVNGNLSINTQGTFYNHNVNISATGQNNIQNSGPCVGFSPQELEVFRNSGINGGLKFLGPTTITINGSGEMEKIFILSSSNVTINVSQNFFSDHTFVQCVNFNTTGTGTIEIGPGKITATNITLGSTTSYLGCGTECGHLTLAGGHTTVGPGPRQIAQQQAAAALLAQQQAAALLAQQQREAQQRAQEEAARREREDLAQKQGEFDTAKQAAIQQKNAFEAVANSLDALSFAKTTAEANARAKLQLLNTSITNLNQLKSEHLTLEAISLIKVSMGTFSNDIYNKAAFNPTNIAQGTFAAAANPADFQAAKQNGQALCNQIIPLNPPHQSAALVTAKTQAQTIGQQITAYKTTLEQAANTLRAGKTHADGKTQEFQAAAITNNNLSAAEQQSINQEKLHINSQILMEINAPDTQGRTPLIKAAQQGNDIAIKYIFENMNDAQIADISFNMKDLSGKTASHYLVAQGLQTEARLFLEKGANPYVPDDEGYTSHMLAVSSGHAQLADEMVRKFGQPELTPELRTKVFAAPEILNAQDESGDRLFTKACMDGKVAVIKYILKFGISNLALDLQNLSGQTALHILIEKNMIPEAKLLLEKGANPYIEDAGAHSAYSQALATGAMQELCALMIQKFGPTPNMNQAEHKDDDVESTFSDLSDLGDKLLGLGLAGNVEHHDDVF